MFHPVFRSSRILGFAILILLNDTFVLNIDALVMSQSLFELSPYTSPEWASGIIPSPQSIVRLSRLPTPIHKFKLVEPDSLSQISIWIKRDDLSSFDLSGNKVRKLEFLLAEAVRLKHDCVVTVGGIQSNHARATAIAARQLSLDSHLILRTANPDSDPGFIGNLLLDRMVGAHISLVSPGTYAQIGQHGLILQKANELRSQGRNPYIIPVGGSNAIGTWGYIEFIRELIPQLQELALKVDHIVFACGSGGTACGIALAVRLAGLATKVHAMAVCDSAQYFYSHMEQIALEMGLDYDKYGPSSDWCTVHAAQGIGYAKSTDEELRFVLSVSRSTGIILDPVYSGKALYYFSKLLERAPETVPTGETVLFLHTGGTFGLYDKIEQLSALNVFPPNQIEKMKITRG